MRAYNYGRRRIPAIRYKRWQKTKVLLMLSGGGVVLSVLFYLIATK
jgi:hypothetical protein